VYQTLARGAILITFFYGIYSKSCNTLPTMKIVKFEFNPSFRGMQPNGPIGHFHFRQTQIIFVTALFIIVLNILRKFRVSLCTSWWVLAVTHRQTCRHTDTYLYYTPRPFYHTNQRNKLWPRYVICFLSSFNFIHQSCTNCMCNGYYNNYCLPSLTICRSTVIV